MAGRDLSLAPRKVATRKKLEVEVFELTDIDTHFSENVQSVEQKFEVANGLMAEDKIAEAKDIWRSQIVFLDSAFDFYLHEIIKLGILSIYHGDCTKKTEKYNNLPFCMSDLELALSNTEDDTWLKDWVNKQYAKETLMSYSAFKDVCNLLGLDINSIADAVYYQRGSTEKTIDKMKRRVDALFFRRNRIAHQMDRQRENAERQDITEQDVKDFIEDVKKIVQAINAEVKKNISTV